MEASDTTILLFDLRTIRTFLRLGETNSCLDPCRACDAFISFIQEACNHYLGKQKVSTVVTTTVAGRRKRSRLKGIVVSEQNYLLGLPQIDTLPFDNKMPLAFNS